MWAPPSAFGQVGVVSGRKEWVMERTTIIQVSGPGTSIMMMVVERERWSLRAHLRGIVEFTIGFLGDRRGR